MQQHISPEWLDELTPEEKDALRGMWEPQIGSGHCHYWPNENDEVALTPSIILQYENEKLSSGGMVWFYKSAALPLLSIGEMLELLEKQDECLNITHLVMFGPEGWGWEIRLRHADYYKFTEGELARALWEAVKEVLREGRK